MPEYLAPGVYVEETSFRARSIQGVGTSTTGFVGLARKGPTDGLPELVTSFGEFERMFGGLGRPEPAGRQHRHHQLHGLRRPGVLQRGRLAAVRRARVPRSRRRPGGRPGAVGERRSAPAASARATRARPTTAWSGSPSGQRQPAPARSRPRRSAASPGSAAPPVPAATTCARAAAGAPTARADANAPWAPADNVAATLDAERGGRRADHRRRRDRRCRRAEPELRGPGPRPEPPARARAGRCPRRRPGARTCWRSPTCSSRATPTRRSSTPS